MRALLFLGAILLSLSVEARVVDITCVLPANDVNGNPAQVQGVRFYANGTQIADEPACAASVDMPDGTYDFTWAAYNSVGEAAQSGPTRFTVVPERGVPEQGNPPSVNFSAVDAGPPDREYFATTPSRDSIHPDVPAGTRIRVWTLAGNVEVNSKGSTRADAAPYSVAWAEETSAGWSEPREIIWN